MLDIQFEDFKESKYRGTGEFHEGLALVQNHDNKFGFMNTSGKAIIPCQFTHALSFSENLAAVQNESGMWGYINHEGELVIPYQYEHAYHFKNGLAVVVDAHDNWGYINKEGIEVIPCKFKQARSFEEGYGIVQDDNFMYHYINETGHLSEPYEECLNFENGTAIVKQDGNYQQIGRDFKAKKILPKNIKKIYHSSCGMRVFQTTSGKYGYMDSDLNSKIPIYEFMRPFYSDVASATLLEIRGILNKNGNFLPISKGYDEIDDFYEGIARTVKEKKYGYITKRGVTIKTCQYKEADCFSEGLAGVMTEDGSISYINRKGTTKLTIPDLYCSQMTYDDKTITLRASTPQNLRKMKIQKLEEIKKAYIEEINAVKQEVMKSPQFVLKENQ